MDNEVKNNSAKNRFEIVSGNEIAMLTYHYYRGDLVLIHTEVPERLQGNDFSGSLARAAFDFAIAQKMKVIVYCPVVAKYLEKHPELNYLVKADHSKDEINDPLASLKIK